MYNMCSGKKIENMEKRILNTHRQQAVLVFLSSLFEIIVSNKLKTSANSWTFSADKTSSAWRVHRGRENRRERIVAMQQRLWPSIRFEIRACVIIGYYDQCVYLCISRYIDSSLAACTRNLLSKSSRVSLVFQYWRRTIPATKERTAKSQISTPEGIAEAITA